MAFKYINPGYDGLWVGDSTVAMIQSRVFNPTHGVSCHSIESGYSFKSEYIGACQDLYLKFDVYFVFEGNNGCWLRVGAKDISCIRVQMAVDGTFEVKATYESTEKVTGEDTNLKPNAVNTIYVQVHFGTSSYVVININGAEILYEELGDYSKAASEVGCVFFECLKTSPVSNVIISDEEIDPREIIVQIEASEVETDMTETDGVYSSALVGSYVRQTLNTAALRPVFGADCKILGMAVVSSPAYSTYGDSDIWYLTFRVDNGTTSTDYNVYLSGIREDAFDEDERDILELLTATEEISKVLLYSYGRQLPIAEDTTLESLNGLKVSVITVGDDEV